MGTHAVKSSANTAVDLHPDWLEVLVFVALIVMVMTVVAVVGANAQRSEKFSEIPEPCACSFAP